MLKNQIRKHYENCFTPQNFFFVTLYTMQRESMSNEWSILYTCWRIWGTVIVFQMTIFKYMIFYNNVNSKYSYPKKMFGTCNLNIIVQSVGWDHHPSDSFHGSDNFAFWNKIYKYICTALACVGIRNLLELIVWCSQIHVTGA